MMSGEVLQIVSKSWVASVMFGALYKSTTCRTHSSAASKTGCVETKRIRASSANTVGQCIRTLQRMIQSVSGEARYFVDEFTVEKFPFAHLDLGAVADGLISLCYPGGGKRCGRASQRSHYSRQGCDEVCVHDTELEGWLPLVRRWRGLSGCGCGSLRVALFEPHDHDIEHGREEETEAGNSEHAEEDGGAESLAHFGAGAAADDQRKHAENKGKGSHQDRAQSEAAGFDRGRETIFPVAVLNLFGELDDEDGVLAGEPDQARRTRSG